MKYTYYISIKVNNVMKIISIDSVLTSSSSLARKPLNTTTVPIIACVNIGLLILGRDSFFSASCSKAVDPSILRKKTKKQNK